MNRIFYLVPICLTLFFSQLLAAEEVEMIDVAVGEEASFGSHHGEASEPLPVQGAWSADPLHEGTIDGMLQESLQMIRQMDKRMANMRSQMDQFFNQSFQGSSQDPLQSNQTSFFPNRLGGLQSSYAYEEAGDKIILRCYIPGTVKQSLEIKVDSHSVFLSGTSGSKGGSSGDQSTYYAMSQSSFMKQFPLHEAADYEQYDVDIQDDAIVITFDRKS